MLIMKNKWLKIGAILLGFFFILILASNFILNFWLKKNLPSYLKENTDYIINYKQLDVDLGTGNIFSTGISVNTKNPDNREIFNIQGTVDTLKIGKFGIIDFIFNKRISTSELEIANAQLNLILPKPKDKKKENKNPFKIRNISIRNSKINLYKDNLSKLFSANHFNLKAKNVKLKEEDDETLLPVTFDEYSIDAENLFFRQKNTYAITSKKISTKNGKLNIQQFNLKPLLSFTKYAQIYPKKGGLFDVQIQEINLDSIALKPELITASSLHLVKPEIKIYQRKAIDSAKKSSGISIRNLALDSASIQLLKPDGSTSFRAQNLNAKISDLQNNKEKGSLPISFSKLKLDGQKVNFETATQNIEVGALALNEKSGDFHGIEVKPKTSSSTKTIFDIRAKRAFFNIKEWNVKNKKLKLNVENILVDGISGTVKAAQNPIKKKSDFSGIEFPLTIKNVQLTNANVRYEKGKQPLFFSDLNARFQNIEMNAETAKTEMPFTIGNFSVTTRNFNYDTAFYTLSAGLLKANPNSVQVNNFKVKPKYSRSQFIKMIPTERDLYTISANKIEMKGNWDFFTSKKYLNATELNILNLDANIFRSKIPKDDPKIKPMYSELLRKIKFPMFIVNTNIKNSNLVYEEDTKASDGPGKLEFANFNLNAKNLNSGKMKGKPTKIPITIDAQFFKVSPLHVKWNIDTQSMNDAFTIGGTISSLPATRLNAFVEPYLKIRTTGSINHLKFNFHGNKNGLDGTFNMMHKDLKVSILKETGEKNKLLSAVANIFVRSNSDKFPESVVVDDVERDPTKSFFNLFWKGIEEGLKKTLIGTNVEKTEQKVKNTVQTAKETTQSVTGAVKDAKSAAKDVKNAVSEVTSAKQKSTKTPEKTKEKEGFFKRTFKKKEKAE